jgi:diadenosine tetraphosphatase ApaH/serine/threonine PP2A family protein phosphatase
MRYVVFTDIHANIEALDACLADAKPRGFDAALVLGDVVGYGPDPNAVCDCLHSLPVKAIVRGNHDKVALGVEQADGFNAAARNAARWTVNALTPANHAWIAALPKGPVEVDELVLICHGTPFDEDTYIFDELDAMRAIASSTRRVCLFGHTHYAVAFELTSAGLAVVGPSENGGGEIELKDGSRYLVNPGSVGQPRDGDPRAAYAVVDTATKRMGMYRVHYPMEITQEKMLRAGLPEPLARRLSSGR